MSPFIESLKRLYALGKLDEKKILALLEENKISQEEYNYITQ